MGLSSKFLSLLPFEVQTSRREFLKRSVIMGSAIPLAGTLLAACGGDDDDSGDDTEGEGGSEGSASPAGATSTTSRAIPTNSSSGGATPEPDASPTEAEAEETEAPEDEGSPEAEATTGTGGTGAGEPKTGGEVILMGHHEISSLSPDDDGPTVHWVLTTNLFNGMMQLDPYFVLQPVLAESYEAAADGTSFSFKLVEGVMFHDGEEMTAEDVKYTFEFYSNPDNAAIQAANFTTLDTVEVVDDYNVTINLKNPDAAFLSKAGQTYIVPAHYHGEIGEIEFKSKPIGTGAFTVEEYDPASHAVLAAFDDHFRGRPLLDRYRENIVPEASVRKIALESGEAHHSAWSLLTEDNIALRDSGDFTTYITSSVAVNHFPINNNRPQFQEKVVRQAMMHAIDRDAIVNELWRGLAVKATANLSPALEFYYEPDVKQYEYDPDLAMSMLEEAGWVAGADGIREKDGVRLEWTCGVITGDQARKPEAEIVAEWLGQIGMKMNIEERPSTSTDMQNDNLDMALYNWTYGGGNGEPDASDTLRSDALNNFSHYKNPDLDALLDAGLAEVDADARKVIYSDLQKLVAEEVPFLFIKFWDWFSFFNPMVKGLPENPLTTTFYSDAYLWWLDEEA